MSSGIHETTLLLVGRVVGHIQLYREQGEGRGENNIKDKELQDQELQGRNHRGELSSNGMSPHPPPPQLSSTTSGTVVERDPRRRGAWAVRFRGKQKGIGWIPYEIGIQ